MRGWLVLRFSPPYALALDATEGLIALTHLARISGDPLVTVCRAKREYAKCLQVFEPIKGSFTICRQLYIGESMIGACSPDKERGHIAFKIFLIIFRPNLILFPIR